MTSKALNNTTLRSRQFLASLGVDIDNPLAVLSYEEVGTLRRAIQKEFSRADNRSVSGLNAGYCLYLLRNMGVMAPSVSSIEELIDVPRVFVRHIQSPDSIYGGVGRANAGDYGFTMTISNHDLSLIGLDASGLAIYLPPSELLIELLNEHTLDGPRYITLVEHEGVYCLHVNSVHIIASHQIARFNQEGIAPLLNSIQAKIDTLNESTPSPIKLNAF